MIFGPVQPTPYDLTFTLLKVPVRVSAWHWAVGGLLGYDTLRMGLPYLLSWLLVFFVSILVHEMGHALMARYFGYSPRVQLHGFGGVAYYEPYYGYTRTRSILITLAGPGAGFVLYGLTLLLAKFGLPYLVKPLAAESLQLIVFVLTQLLYVNLIWGLLNLMPVMPLDGGQVCREVCQWASPRRGMEYALKIGIVAAALVALFFFLNDRIYGAMLFGMLCANNVSALQAGQGRW